MGGILRPCPRLVRVQADPRCRLSWPDRPQGPLVVAYPCRCPAPGEKGPWAACKGLITRGLGMEWFAVDIPGVLQCR